MSNTKFRKHYYSLAYSTVLLFAYLQGTFHSGTVVNSIFVPFLFASNLWVILILFPIGLMITHGDNWKVMRPTFGSMKTKILSTGANRTRNLLLRNLWNNFNILKPFASKRIEMNHEICMLEVYKDIRILTICLHVLFNLT